MYRKVLGTLQHLYRNAIITWKSPSFKKDFWHDLWCLICKLNKKTSIKDHKCIWNFLEHMHNKTLLIWFRKNYSSKEIYLLFKYLLVCYFFLQNFCKGNNLFILVTFTKRNRWKEINIFLKKRKCIYFRIYVGKKSLLENNVSKWILFKQPLSLLNIFYLKLFSLKKINFTNAFIHEKKKKLKWCSCLPYASFVFSFFYQEISKLLKSLKEIIYFRKPCNSCIHNLTWNQTNKYAHNTKT